MIRTNIFLEERQHQQVMELAKQDRQSFSGLVREMIDEGIRERKRQQWNKAAEMMVRDYAEDYELTAFIELDSEDFLE